MRDSVHVSFCNSHPGSRINLAIIPVTQGNKSGEVMASHSRNHSKHGHEETRASGVWKLHKDWRAWLAILLMLLGIVMYVFSLDDSIIPR